MNRKSQPLTKDQIRVIVEDPEFSRKDMAEVLLETFGMKVKEDLTNDELTDFIYEAYNEKAREIATVRNISKRGIVKQKLRQLGDSAGNTVSRADFIIGVIAEKGTTSRRELEKLTDEAFHYQEAGKSSRTRVNRVLSRLLEEEKITLDGGTVTWIVKK